MTAITSFKGEFSFLSNFEPCEVVFEGAAYPSAEHAYQSAKSTDPQIRSRFQSSYFTAAGAKKLGRQINMRPDWDDVKLEVMKAVLLDKFTRNAYLGALLINTHPRNLIEGNYWHDTYWGVCNGVGDNNLGKLLMGVREYLLTEPS